MRHVFQNYSLDYKKGSKVTRLVGRLLASGSSLPLQQDESDPEPKEAGIEKRPTLAAG